MRAVAQGHVRDLVRQHARHLPLVARLLEHPAVDVDESARKREGIDVRRVHDAEPVREPRPAGIRRQPLSDAVDVGLDLIVADDRQLLLGLYGRLLADLHVLLRREEIESRLHFRLPLGDRSSHHHRHGQRENFHVLIHQ